MMRAPRFSRRFGIGVLALTLTLGGVLARPNQTSAGFGSSPGSPRVAAACDSGTHFPDATLAQRKAGEGQKDFG
jgi:hypothetical protein